MRDLWKPVPRPPALGTFGVWASFQGCSGTLLPPGGEQGSRKYKLLGSFPSFTILGPSLWEPVKPSKAPEENDAKVRCFGAA